MSRHMKTVMKEIKLQLLTKGFCKDIRCGPSIVDYPETSGNLRKPAAEVS
jgi:hypothetical protein